MTLIYPIKFDALNTPVDHPARGKEWIEIDGCGIERIAMVMWSINDIRLFTENDVRFLEQF